MSAFKCMHSFQDCLHCYFMICSTNMIKSSTISKNKKFYNYTVTQYKMEKKTFFTNIQNQLQIYMLVMILTLVVLI